MSALPPGWARGNPEVICLGLSAMDHVWTVPKLPAGAGKSRASNFTSIGGGMAATAAVAVARLGGRARFWGRAGQDEEGLAMRRELTQHAVDCGHFRLFEGSKSAVSGVLVEANGERAIVNYRGGDLPDEPSWLPIDQVSTAHAVLADPRWPEGAERLFHAARAAGVPTILDADIADAEIFDRLLPLTDHAIFADQALAAYAGAADGLGKVAAMGCKISAVTKGEAGMEWLEDGQIHRCAAVPVQVVDTTGAGDVFHGAWAFAIGAGASSADAARFAAAAAALKCTRPTGRGGIPNLVETIELWRRNA